MDEPDHAASIVSAARAWIDMLPRSAAGIGGRMGFPFSRPAYALEYVEAGIYRKK
jgi:hypothetical protein